MPVRTHEKKIAVSPCSLVHEESDAIFIASPRFHVSGMNPPTDGLRPQISRLVVTARGIATFKSKNANRHRDTLQTADSASLSPHDRYTHEPKHPNVKFLR